MTSPGGGVRIPVTADASDFAGQLRRAVMEGVRQVQAELRTNPINLTAKVTLKPDLTQLRRDMRAVNNLTADVALRTTVAERNRFVSELNRQLKERRILVYLTPVVDMQELRQRLRNMPAGNVNVNLNLTQAEWNRFSADLRRRLRDAAFEVPISPRLRGEEDLRRRLDQLTRDRSVDVDVDVHGGALGRLTGLNSGLGSITGALAGLTGGTAALAAIGGAAGAAAGAVGGLAVGFAALGPAAAAAAGTAAVALSGIKDAFDAASAAAEAGPDEAAASAKAAASAQNQLASALDGATSAQESYADATKSAEDANRAVADSYQQAAEDLEDLQFKLRGSVLDQKEAAINLAEAQAEFNKVQFDPSKNEKALVRLQRAQLTYDKSVADGVDVAEEFADAQAKGIENSDRVVAAKEAAAQADRRVQDAARQVEAAQRSVAQAQAAVAEASAAATPKADAYAQAMAKLAPAAQEFVLAARDLAPTWAAMGDSVQQTAWEGIAGTFTDVANRVIPVLGTGMNLVAAQFNAAAQSALTFVGSAQGLEGLRSTFAGTANLLGGMRSGVGGFAQGLIDLTRTAEPNLFGIGQAFANIGGEIGKAISAAAGDGTLSNLFAGFTETLRGAAPLLGSLVSSLITLGSAVLPSLGPLLESIGGVLTTIAPSLGALGAEFARSLTSIMPQLGTFIAALADGLRPVLPVIAQLLGAAFQALTPLIGPLSDIAQTVGNALVGAIQALAPSLGPMAEAFSALVTAVAPLVPLIAENLSVVLQALAPALTEVFNALGPVISELATQMKPVIAELAPVLAETARIVGVALADAIRQLAPSIPDLVRSFTDLMLALVPLLPEFARMAAELLPPLVDILVQITPQVVKLFEALTWLANNVIIPYVVPAIGMMVDQLRTGLEFVGTAIGTMRDVVSAVKDYLVDQVFPAMGRGIDRVTGWFQSGVDAISTAWNGLKEAAAVPIRYVVNTVWNDGLRKAWNSVAGFLPGLGQLEPVTLGFATGGAVWGPGTGTSDSIPAWLSTGEHIITAAEVIAAGGQNAWYAIRDMIARGIPFRWDGGRVIQDLGRQNVDAYGAAVKAKGIGNVSPEGLFDQLVPRFQGGGAVEPWMYQLLRGHQFAQAQNGRPYQWAGPRFVGDSFDCSGFMGSIAAAILGLNVWQRYWSTGNFSGQQVGPQGFTLGQADGGMVIGVSNGGPGGGHTAGVLGALPLLGIPQAMRVESGGALGDVHYGAGTDPRSFQMLYGLPIGANGFFQPGTGGGSVGPSPGDQANFVQRQIDRIFREITDPIKGEIEARIGPPPPAWRKVPPEFLTTVQDKSVQHLAGLVGGLGDLLPGAWQKAQEFAGRAFDALNPFDSGGVASGTGFLPKNVIEPERVLSPEQTRLFEALVVSLQQIAGAGSAAVGAPELLTAQVFQQGINTLASSLAAATSPDTGDGTSRQEQQLERIDTAMQEAQHVLADTVDLIQRTASSQELVTQEQTDQLQAGLNDIAGRLAAGVLGPIMQSAVDAGVGIIQDWLGSVGNQVTAGTDRTTRAVQNLDVGGGSSASTATAAAPFGAPGSAFDAISAISDAVVSVANTAAQTFQQVASAVANAALAQQASRVDDSRGTLGKDISGGPLVDMIVRLTGVEIEIRNTLTDTLEEIHTMRGSLVGTFDSSGRIVADTAELMQRNESSRDLVISEQNRLNRELIKAVLRYLMTAVVIPIMTAILGAMIQLATTAIGAAIGSFIPVIGTAIGAAIGAVVGAALAGVAAVFTGALAVGAAAAIDSFDSGGVAVGMGLLAKDIVEPERVLSPRQTELFERMVGALESGDRGGNRTVNAPITYVGTGGPGAVQDRLLKLLN